MSNTPCAYAVDSVLHRRVEIKTQSSRSLGKRKPAAAGLFFKLFLSEPYYYKPTVYVAITVVVDTA
jgi:hypothetical protein